MEVGKNQETDIIQIRLYPLVKIVPSLNNVLKLGLMTIVFSSLLMNYLFLIKEPLLIISASSLFLIIVLTIRYHHFLFPVSNTTLILAYNLLYLLQENQLEWCKKRTALHFKKQIVRDSELFNIHIYEKENLLITIHYPTLKRVQIKTNSKINYTIYAQDDWQILNRYINKIES